MTAGRWRPLSARSSDSGDAYETLAEGVPSWLTASLARWVSKAVGYGLSNTGAYIARIETLEQVLRRPLASAEVRYQHVRPFLLAAAEDEEVFLDVIDALLALLSRQHPSLGKELESHLSLGGSAWRVADDGTRLERRVPEEIAQAVTEAVSSNDRAAQHLKQAWQDVYGRTTDPSDGYREAVRAVEAIAQPVVLPSDAKATLGKMVTALRAKPQKWIVHLEHSQPDQQVETVAAMMELLWKGEHDRHGTSDPNAPLNVSIDEARAAVFLAALLVQWFRAGVVSRT